MFALRARSGWVGRWTALLGLVVLVTLTACTTTVTVVATPPSPLSDDDDFSDLVAQLRADLSRSNSRLVTRTPVLTPTAPTAKARDKEFAARANALFTPLTGSALLMPVIGVRPFDLSNSWGDARDGGRRKHRGID